MKQSVHTVVCTHCNVRMTEHQNPGGVQYFRCGSCHRWVSSTYAEILEADAKFRSEPTEAQTQKSRQFEEVKQRLERWLSNLEGQDPYQVLGVSPRSSPEEIKSRYREAALRHHPDRGGSAEKMAELNQAYERVTQHLERADVPRPAAAATGGLPARGTNIPSWKPKAPSLSREQRSSGSRSVLSVNGRH